MQNTLSSLFDATASSDDGVPDESILNVLRRSDEKVLKTSEIADPLPIKQGWTSDRLKTLEGEGRVHSKKAGSGRVWWLDDSEPTHPVAEGFEDVRWWVSLLSNVGTNVAKMGVGVLVLSGMLLIPIFALFAAPTWEFGMLTTENLVTVALVGAIDGGLFLVVGGGFKLGGALLQRKFLIE
ncbi:hypothetical protein [Halomarina oriensis]|uniref:hypothetical protein n=1 Tax=Halomarina oriensis TaxID=671145 RepID=UPI0018EF184D|nr:hypothetical protein [Halomarina oriensis]